MPLNSCKNENNYPSLNFIGGKDLVSQDVILKENSTFKVGINSFTKTEHKLFNFKLIRVYENNPLIVIDSNLNVNYFNSIFTLPTQNKESVERWIFSVSSSDGYTSEISVQVTSSDTLTSLKETDGKLINYVKEDLPDNKYVIILSISTFSLIIIIILLFLLFKKSRKNVEKVIVYEEGVNKERKTNNIIYIIIMILVILAAIAKSLFW